MGIKIEEWKMKLKMKERVHENALYHFKGVILYKNAGRNTCASVFMTFIFSKDSGIRANESTGIFSCKFFLNRSNKLGASRSFSFKMDNNNLSHYLPITVHLISEIEKINSSTKGRYFHRANCLH